MKRTITALAFIILLWTVVPAFAGVVRIGLMASLSGGHAAEGRDMRNAIVLLAEAENKAGGINGDSIEIIVEDDGSTASGAIRAAQRLCGARVSAVVGGFSTTVTDASQSLFDEAGIVQIASGASAVHLTTKGYSFFFRISPKDDDQGRMLANVVLASGSKRVAVLHDTSAYSRGLAEETRRTLAAKSFTLVSFGGIPPGGKESSTVVNQLKESSVDFLVYTGYYPEAALLLRQMRAAGLRFPVVGGDGTNNLALVELAGLEAAVGFRFTSPPLPKDMVTGEAKEFLDAYTKRYSQLPGSIWSIAAGDAFRIIVAAIKARGNKAQDIADYLHSRSGYFPGYTGPIAFDAKGDRMGDIYRLYVVTPDGRFAFASPVAR